METIPGLCSFMERGMVQKVNMEELAMKYKEDTGRDPVMLVDVSNVLFKLQDSRYDNYCCGHLKRFKKNLETLINNCYKIKIKLIFFGTGIQLQEDWAEKCERKLDSYHIFNFHRGILFNVFTCVVKSSDKCEYIRAKYKREILRYAKTYGCFAIFAHGSAYIIAEGAQYNFSIKHFELDEMLTTNYNRNQLAKVLEISPSQLPLFGAVSACQTIAPKYAFFSIAKLMKTFSPTGIEKFPEIFQMDVEEFNKSLKYFSGDEPKEVMKPVDGDWGRIISLAEERHRHGVAHRNILECILHHVFFVAPKIKHEFLSPGAELLPLRTRIYGILFNEYPGEIFIKDHFFPYNGTSKSEVHEIFVTKSAHCGLIKLWSEDYPKDEKVRLFCRVFGDLTPQDLNDVDINEELLFPFLTAFYLINEVEKELTEYQLKTILIQSILANELTDEDMDLGETTPYDSELLELCDRFLTTADHIMLLNSVCGYPFCMFKTSMENYYDARLFQHVYHTIKNENLKKDEDLWGHNVYATYKYFLSGLEKLKNIRGYVI